MMLLLNIVLLNMMNTVNVMLLNFVLELIVYVQVQMLALLYVYVQVLMLNMLLLLIAVLLNIEMVTMLLLDTKGEYCVVGDIFNSNMN